MSGNDNTTVPSPTVSPPEAPENPSAVPSYNNYEICDRSGFKVLPGTLIKEWDGAMVRPELFDPRHPQDFVRSTSETQKGSIRPEQEDQFIGTDVYPNGVSVSDL